MFVHRITCLYTDILIQELLDLNLQFLEEKSGKKIRQYFEIPNYLFIFLWRKQATIPCPLFFSVNMH